VALESAVSVHALIGWLSKKLVVVAAAKSLSEDRLPGATGVPSAAAALEWRVTDAVGRCDGCAQARSYGQMKNEVGIAITRG